MSNIKIICLFLTLISLRTTFISAQNEQKDRTVKYLDMKWNYVATKMPSEWYVSDEAKLVAENVLQSQKEIGGWEKNKHYHHIFSDSLKAYFIHNKAEIGGTFDNGSTITELRFLAKVYSHLKDERYKQAFDKGIDYILIAQYENGGWPQFYPVRTAENEFLIDKTEPYSAHITYNDNAMVNIMKFLQDIYSNYEEFKTLQISRSKKDKAKKAFDKGVECMLKTQIIVNKELTVWCAQHDEKTLAPAKARKYELESFSGSESVGITLLLMNIKNPSKEIVASIVGSVNWFEKHKLVGIKLESEIDKDGKKNRIVVEDKNASPLWARFYDLLTGKPFFCDRDGIKKNSLAEIGYERRNGYGWYTDAPAELLKKYHEWKKR